MSRWFTENWSHMMGTTDQLLDDLRHNAAEARVDQIDALLRQAEQQRAAMEQTLHSMDQQRQALQHSIDELQRELAVAGQPLRGEIS